MENVLHRIKKSLLFPLGIGLFAAECHASDVLSDQKKNNERGLANLSTTIPGTFDVFGDLLVWYASEQTSSSWANVIAEEETYITEFKAEGAFFDWNLGFRFGVGYQMEYDGWDTQLYWTWFRTKASSSIPSNRHTVFSEFFGSFIDLSIAESAKLHWTLLYNMFDWELGRGFFVSKNLMVRPFIGLKGGWINQTIHSEWENVRSLTPPIVFYFPSKENLKNNFWGIGPSGGVNTKWKLRNFKTHFPSLFGDFSAAMMWGTWECKDQYTNPTPKQIDVHMNNSQLGALMVRGFMGFGWDVDCNGGKSHFSTQLGYEMQLWVNQLRIPTFQQLRLHGDLTLQGGTFNCRMDF